jgi:DNA polymerase elongation subunit (family B)
MNIDSLLNNALVFDLETSAHYSDGREVSIRTNFDDYVMLAKVKWFGAYSYRDKKQYYLEASKNREKIMGLLSSHNILIGFNNEEFDYPILINNGLIDRNQKINHIDCMKILGASSFKDRNGYKYKDRGNLMGYKFKRNSLECMAETMELEFQKSKIDYKIFYKDVYTEKEKTEIIKYLKNDVMATKGMFDKLWLYWMPFVDLIDWKFVSNFSWIKSSIASLIYKSACFCINTEPTYSEHGSKIEEMGGRVLDPKYEEATDVWYVDFASLYPHIFCMFNLFAEVPKESTGNIWSGNNMFKAKGSYDVSYKHPLVKAVEGKLKERLELKAKDKDHPMVQTLKIWLNGLYGVARSPLFEKVHTPNCGWDCCWLGQQIQEFTENELAKYGYESIYGDTDSLMIRGTQKKHNDKDYIKTCLKQIIKKILANVPFPVKTFDMDIETFIPYMLFPFSDQEVVDENTRKLLNKKIIEGYEERLEDKKKVIIDIKTNKIVKRGRSWIKERMGRKKNYAYLYEKDNELKVKLVGLPIKKANATQLGIKIYKEILKPKILKEKKAKFSKEFVDGQISEYLKDKEIMKLISREFKIKPLNTYASESNIYAQISKGYFNGGEGVINLIKNFKIGKAGKGTSYCTVEEAIRENLTIEDLDLEKLYNELEPFIKYVKPDKIETKKKPKSSEKKSKEKVAKNP